MYPTFLHLHTIRRILQLCEIYDCHCNASKAYLAELTDLETISLSDIFLTFADLHQFLREMPLISVSS